MHYRQQERGFDKMQWNLIRLRKELGITQEEMSKILDISLSSYIRKEAGEYEFKMNEAFILRDFFKKSLEEIFLPRNCNGVANNAENVVCNCKSYL